MAKELNEDTNFNLSIKTLISLGIGISVLIGFWYQIQNDIEEAKELPAPAISRTEYDLKDQLIRETIENTAKQVEENSDKLDKIDEKLFEIIQR